MDQNIENARKIPLRGILIVPFVLQIFASVGLTGYFSLQYGEKAVNHVAEQLRGEIATRIEQNLHSYLATPHLVNQINADALSLGQLNIEDLTALERHFLRQKNIFYNVDAIIIVTEKGQGIAINSNDEGKVFIQVTSTTNPNQLYIYSVSKKGERNKLIKIYNSTFIPNWEFFTNFKSGKNRTNLYY